MSSSNFCKNCGTRLSRKGWRTGLRGAICDDCAKRPGVTTRSRSLIGVLLIVVGAFAFGRYLRPAPPPLIIQRAGNSPVADTPVDLNALVKDAGANQSLSATTAAAAETDDTVYLCGARTQKGTPCRRRVHVAGERCYQHKGRSAMVALEKLVIKPDAAKK